MVNDILLTCIEIARNKGILFNEKDLDKAKEYIENMLIESEIDRIIRREKFTINNATVREAKNVSKSIVTKLKKQKELLRWIITLLGY